MSLPASALDAQSLAVRVDDGHVPVLVMPPDMPFEELRAMIRERMPGLLVHIGGRASRMDIGERKLDLFELRRLIHVLRDEFAVQITGLYLREDEIQRFAERELKLKLFPLLPTPVEVEPDPDEDTEIEDENEVEDEVDNEVENEIENEPEIEQAEVAKPASEDEPVTAPAPGRRTQYVDRTLRSGASVRFEGDIIVLGDVNPGAQVVAAGNVIVMGTLKGLAHAGALGDDAAFVFALSLEATQIRIARKIAIPPARGVAGPEVARITDERVVIEPYRHGGSR